MPYLNGIEMANSIYKLNKEQKIIITSAHTEKEYLLPLLELGIETFIEKPLSINNLIDSLIKIINNYWTPNEIILTDKCTYTNSSLIYDDSIKLLTNKEIKLIELLLNNKDKYFTLEDIYYHLYLHDLSKEFNQEAIRSIIKRFRKKLPENILINIRTLGYKLNINP